MHYVHKEDFQIASRFLFLSMAIRVIDQDIQKVHHGTFKIKEPYLKLLDLMASSARKERKMLRKQMLDREIQVMKLNQTDSFVTYLFISNKKEESKNYFTPVIRKKVRLILEELMVDSLQQYCSSSASD